MKSGVMVFSAGLLALGACNREPQQATANAPLAPTNEVMSTNEAAPPSPTPPVANAPTVNEPTSLPEPKGPIDPKSAEAAGQVVQHYGALIEQRRFDEAEKLWGNADSAGQFTLQLRRYPEAHLEIGKPGDMEGAAGSIYVTVPVTFYGKDRNDSDFRRAADIILRRVNDVPGSTLAQRRWHIERVEQKGPA